MKSFIKCKQTSKKVHFASMKYIVHVELTFPWDIPKYFVDFISVKYVMFMLQHDNKYYNSKSNIESPKKLQKQTWLSFLSPFYVSYYMNTNGPNPKSKRIKRHNALVSTGREKGKIQWRDRTYHQIFSPTFTKLPNQHFIPSLTLFP